jgi:type IV pilus assembly protein PilA
MPKGKGQPGYLERSVRLGGTGRGFEGSSQTITPPERQPRKMLTSIKQRLDRDDEGFTLIELMVVVLIIAILLAIAIPTFLGARGQANSRAAQSSLRNALTAEQTYYTNNQAFGATTSSPTINSIEPNLQWTATEPTVATANPNSINVILGTVSTTGDTVVLQTEGKDGNCYSVYQTNGTSAGAATGYAITKGDCTATAGGVASPPVALTVTTGSAASNEASGSDAGYYTSW